MTNNHQAKRQRIGTHHGWCLTVRDASIDAFVEIVEDMISEGGIDIAVIGDELSNDNGVRHAQAFLNFPNGRGIAFGKLKKTLIDSGVESCDLHIEPRRSKSLDRAGNYCLKEHFEHIAALFPEKGTVEELYRPDSVPLLSVGWDIEGARCLKGSQGRRTDLESFKHDVLAGECREFDTAMLNHSGLCARAERFVRMFIGRYSPHEPMSSQEWADLLASGNIRRWQAWVIHEMAIEDISYRYRKVHVVTDEVRANGGGGNSGKSHMCDWFPRLMANVGQKVQVLGPGKLADMAAQLQSDVDIVMIDIPASRSEALQWSFIEQLKSGRVDSPKYHSCSIVLKKRPVRVIILCNHHPDRSRRYNQPEVFTNDRGYPVDEYNRPIYKEYTLSDDRWVEYHITSGHDVEAVPDFMLPAEMNFGPEFSSDNAGDGPVNSLNQAWWDEYKYAWLDSAGLWGVSELSSDDLICKLVRGQKLKIKKGHPLAEPVFDVFRHHGWDGNGDLEVVYQGNPDLNNRLVSDFSIFCLEKGIVALDHPLGIVMCDSRERCARVWFNEFGAMTNLVAYAPSEFCAAVSAQMIHSYTIRRGGIFVYSYRGLEDFLDPKSMNGDFDAAFRARNPHIMSE